MAWEATALDLMEAAGIRTPRRRLTRVGTRSVLLLRRFDRSEVGHRIGVESFGREALLGYGMFRATWAQFMRGSLTVH